MTLDKICFDFRQKTLLGFASIALIFSTSFLQAKVEEVTITWTAQLCLYSCAAGLNSQFLKIPAIASVDINQPGGRANLKWRPDMPFSFSPINTAMSMIGLSINELQIRVTGNIIHDDRSVTLISQPDGGRYILKSSTNPAAHKYIEQYNIGGYTLSAQMRAELLDAEAKQQEVEITAKVFQPERSPPVVLIIQRKQIVKASDTK